MLSVALQGEQPGWRGLRFFGLYRLVLAGLFVVLVVSDSLPPPFGRDDPRLFAVLAYFYFVLAIASQVAVENRVAALPALVLGQVLLDTAVLTAMMHASGGVTSGVGMLLLVTVAVTSLLTAGRFALLHAAIASLGILAEGLYTGLVLPYSASGITQAGLLGAGLFATATLSYVLARRLRESEALARQRGLDLQSLSQLNERIVQRMQTGILVLDGEVRLQLANASAGRLLGLDDIPMGRRLAEFAPELEAERVRWRAEGLQSTQAQRSRGGELEFIASFTALGEDGGTLVFLEDVALTRQRAQQLKLASLGRLTASIAHEIRNPLGAVSHAAQLLAESPDRGPEDERLTRIIREHSERMNRIVENVLQLGRRSRAVPESFALAPWLEDFVAELRAARRLGPGEVRVAVEPQGLTVSMDQSQLRQVLANLCDNALRFAQTSPRLELLAGLGETSGRPWLDVLDHGPGIPAGQIDQVFEPFFTGRAEGTGLGLYIARELCEANRASLALAESSTEGCRFRITFARPERE